MFVDHTVFYDIWSLKVCKTTKMYLLKGSPNAPPTAHFSFTAPLELLTTPRRAVPQLGTTALNDWGDKGQTLNSWACVISKPNLFQTILHVMQ